VLASTEADFGERGSDGSFMRLFRYISGANKSEAKIAMTTPVFIEGQSNEAKGSMAFVMPKKLVTTGVPDPEADQVKIRERKGGRFAVIRFAGKLDAALARKQESQLRAWMDQRELEGSETAETAGYDPPFTPGPLRRNEVLIRLKQATSSAPIDSPASAE
jgi:hypothetical protein